MSNWITSDGFASIWQPSLATCSVKLWWSADWFPISLLTRKTCRQARNLMRERWLELGILNEERYRKLSARLRDAGFAPDINDQGNQTLQRWTTGSVMPVTVDFLIPPNEETDKGGLIHYIESDFAAIITPGLELAFGDRSCTELSGHIPSGAWATRNIPVCGPGAFTVLKALAFGNRTENKDAYDLFYVWNGIGVTDVAKSLAPLLPNTNIDNALCIIERDFCSPNGPGPIGAAHFIALRPDENIQADVAGLAQELLRSLGRL